MESTAVVECLVLPTRPADPDPASLYAALTHLTDPRHRRGRRYARALLLTLVVLAKLAGETTISGIAQWARLRHAWLQQVVPLPLPRLPCANTYTRVLAQLDLAALHAILAQHFAPPPAPPAATAASPARASRHLALDGKSLRGTRSSSPVPQAALHQVGLYDVTHRVLLAQHAVPSHDHEVPTVTQLLAGRDLRGCVVTADALHTQRAFCQQVVAQHGDYMLVAKGNQAQLHQDIARLFEGPWPPYLLRHSATTWEKGHGRLEGRCLHASGDLNEFLGARWAGLQQVFQLERTIRRPSRVCQEVVVGITSLPAAVAGPSRLLALSRAHWHLENREHWRRDVTLGEDASRVRTGQAPRLLAALNSLVLTLMDRIGATNVRAQMRMFAANPAPALALLIGAYDF